MCSVWTAAIIAGGQAKRLGGIDKWALNVGGQRIIDRQLAVLGGIAEHILIVSNDPHRFRSLGLRVCADLIPGTGPLGGLYTALVRSPTEHTLVVACDLPFLAAAFLRYLATQIGHADAAVPRTEDGPQPLCAVYTQNCVDAVRAQIQRGRHRMSALKEVIRVAHVGPAEIAAFDRDGKLFLNVNTSDDHRRAIELTAREPNHTKSEHRH
ncbi:MAG: molybdenum cofactor guanylyltransferase [Acidobacteria bacterium]|nr:molybdenum cofactor guanylyltransferase [Acidobacteriota bacterium]